MIAKAIGGGLLKDKLSEITSKIRKAATLDVGFMAGSTESDGTPTPLVAALNEYGVPSHGQPPRPFMRNTIQEHKKDWPDDLAVALRRTNYDAAAALTLVGENIVGQIQDSIQALRSPPLAESTIERKGFDKPLIEHNDMVNSVDYRVNK